MVTLWNWRRPDCGRFTNGKKSTSLCGTSRGTPEEQRANHWYATFWTALDRDNTQGNDSTITLQETIDALKEHVSG
jgi:hypothetical protein